MPIKNTVEVNSKNFAKVADCLASSTESTLHPEQSYGISDHHHERPCLQYPELVSFFFVWPHNDEDENQSYYRLVRGLNYAYLKTKPMW